MKFVKRALKRMLRVEERTTAFDITNRHTREELFATAGVPVPDSPGSATVARRIWQLRPDLREAFPLGLTPVQRREYALWMLKHGLSDFALTPADVLAYLYELDADPSQGLVDSYLWHPSWQRAVPNALTDEGWPRLLNFLIDQLSGSAPWLRQAKRTRTSRIRQAGDRGVNLLGHFRFPSGLQEVALQIERGLKQQGMNLASRDLPVGYPCDCALSGYDDREEFPVSILTTGASRNFDELLPIAGLDAQSRVYRIANWAWELEELQGECVASATLANEFWAISEFVAGAIRNGLPDDERPVFAMSPGVDVPQPAPLNRTDFGLDPERFIVLFAFDMGSSMARKNPLGAIEAFQRAFRPDDPVELVLKISRGDQRPDDLQLLRSAMTGPHRMTLIDRVMPRSEVIALMNICNCYLSLHRAEGLGYTVAEAMLLGKPAIATGYSATSEFLSESNGLPVRYRMVSVGKENPPYPATARWADPDLEHAAQKLRWVYENREAAIRLGAHAKEELTVKLCPRTASKRMADRIDHLLQQQWKLVS